MPNISEAYDFDLFEDRNSRMNYGNTVVSIEPERKREKEPENNVVEIPKVKVNRKRRIHPVKAFATVICYALVFSVVISIVYSNLKLSELNEKINNAAVELDQEKSRGVQLEMKSMEELNFGDIEDYAREELGMTRLTQSQVLYVNSKLEDTG